jgi:hypothetical protein
VRGRDGDGQLDERTDGDDNESKALIENLHF